MSTMMTMHKMDEIADTLVLALDGAGVIEHKAIMALIDLDAPAKVRMTVNEAVTPITREPDFYDADMAWWIGEHGAVGYGVEHQAKAASVAMDHGTKVRQGVLPDEFGLVVMPFGPTWQAGMGKSNLAYTLWTIAQDSVVAR